MRILIDRPYSMKPQHLETGRRDRAPMGLSPLQAHEAVMTRLLSWPLTLTDWARLQDALIVSSFSALDPDRINWPVDGDEQRTIAAIIASRSPDGSDWRFGGARRAAIAW